MLLAFLRDGEMPQTLTNFHSGDRIAPCLVDMNSAFLISWLDADFMLWSILEDDSDADFESLHDICLFISIERNTLFGSIFACLEHFLHAAYSTKQRKFRISAQAFEKMDC